MSKLVRALIVALLAVGSFLMLGSAPASAAVVTGDWGYVPYTTGGYNEITSAEYLPRMGDETIYQGRVICVSGPCAYEPGMTVTTEFGSATIVEAPGYTLDFSKVGPASIGTCTVVTSKQVACVVTASGTVSGGQFLFSGDVATDIHISAASASGVQFSTTTWSPGAGNTSTGNDPANDVQVVTGDLVYFGEDLSVGANFAVAPSSSRTGAYDVTCAEVSVFDRCYYPDLPLGYINYSAGATVTSPVGTTYPLLNGAAEVGTCTVATAVRVVCILTTGGDLPLDAHLTASGWTESIPAGADGTVVRTDTYIPYDGYCRNPEGCGPYSPYNDVEFPTLGDVKANNVRTVALSAAVAPDPTPTTDPTPTALPTTGTGVAAPVLPALAATGANPHSTVGIGLLALASGAGLLVGARRREHRR